MAVLPPHKEVMDSLVTSPSDDSLLFPWFLFPIPVWFAVAKPD